MSRRDRPKGQESLPLRADPERGVVVGTFLLAACLAGPVGLVVALVIWALVVALKGPKAHDEGRSPQDEPTDDEFATRFHHLETDILAKDRRDPATSSGTSQALFRG
jgi:hypothetical protein